MNDPSWTDIVTALGAIGALATPFVLLWIQNRSDKAQAVEAKRNAAEQAQFVANLTTNAMIVQADHAHKLEQGAIERREARELFGAINRHTQQFNFRFARAHPTEIPSRMISSELPVFMPDSDVEAFRKGELVNMCAELNADVLMLGLFFGKETSERTGTMIRNLIERADIILDASRRPELKSLREHNDENATLVTAINQSVKPLWESLNVPKP